MAQRPLIGTSPNQVSTNGMLGDLAFQDSNGAYIETIRGAVNLDKLDKEITDTAVDIFVYDTRKDSDGGSWRKRTQHTSWYNETLNTATRGSRREFPAVAVIVMQEGTLTIYDGDDPDLPMWMVFTDNNDTGSLFASAKMLSCRTPTSISMLNGMLMCGGKGPYHDGVTEINFLTDSAKKHMNNGYYYSTLNISQRENTGGYYTVTSGTPSIVSNLINDVAMTVLPNAPIDDATGLPIPTIAVATNAGVSVIKDDGTVYDLNIVNRPYSSVYFSPDNLVWAVENPGGVNYDLLRYFEIPSADITVASSYGPSSNPALFPTNTQGNIFDSFAYGSPVGLTKIDHADGSASATNGLVAYATTSYNTGWMHGDIKGAFLSDTDATNVTGSELVTNGTFDTNTDNWTANGSTLPTLSVDTNRLKLTHNGANGGAYQNITTVVGETYTVSAVLTNGNASYVRLRVYGDGSTGDGFQGTNYTGDSISSTSATTDEITFVAETTTTRIYIEIVGTSAEYAFADNVVARIADPDRSVNNNGLQVFGTVTKSAVATGAELVAYSGFSNSNYLTQPYNSDMQTGNGDFSVMCWFKTTSTVNAYEGLIYYNTPGALDGGFQLMMGPTADNKGLYWYIYGSTVNKQIGLVTGLNDGNWHHVVATYNSSTVQLYVDGTLKLSGAHNAGGFSNSNAQFTVGRWYGNSSTEYYWRGDLTLVRHSASIPSAEQIKKIYEDEKVLFQENAACTLYGSSDAVTALAYDDSTNLLYAGTSSGRSDFQGLRRINNTTTAVTTAISASNGLVAEQ